MIPNLIPGFLGSGTTVFLHTENGLLGVGPRPREDELDPDLIDAAKQPVTALAGAATFDSAASFAMAAGSSSAAPLRVARQIRWWSSRVRRSAGTSRRVLIG